MKTVRQSSAVEAPHDPTVAPSDMATVAPSGRGCALSRGTVVHHRRLGIVDAVDVWMPSQPGAPYPAQQVRGVCPVCAGPLIVNLYYLSGAYSLQPVGPGGVGYITIRECWGALTPGGCRFEGMVP